MSLEYILKQLEDCKNNNCKSCKLNGVPAMLCQYKLIKKVANELREYLETKQDDGK